MLPLAALLWGTAAQAEDPSAFSATYGDWRASCRVVSDTPEPSRHCTLDQSLSWRDEESGVTRPLVNATLTAPGDDGHSEAVFIVPFGLLLTEGASLWVDDGEPFAHWPFYICFSEGCALRGRLDGEALKTLERGQTLTLRMQATGGKGFRVELPLTGFAIALARLREEAAR